MPKKTAYSRSGAQRNKTKQKSFELVRPASDADVLETVEESEGEENEEREEVVDVAVSDQEEEEEEVVEEVKPKAGKSASAKAGATAAAVLDTPASAGNSPKSAAARLAARRQAVQKTQRSSSNLITVEHYNYVRRDLIFILILAVILFGTIVALHFILGG